MRAAKWNALQFTTVPITPPLTHYMVAIYQMPLIIILEHFSFNTWLLHSCILSAKPLQAFEFGFPKLELRSMDKLTETHIFHPITRMVSLGMALIAMDKNDFTESDDFQGNLEYHLAATIQRKFIHWMIS